MNFSANLKIVVQLSGKGNDSSRKSKGGSGSITVECT